MNSGKNEKAENDSIKGCLSLIFWPIGILFVLVFIPIFLFGPKVAWIQSVFSETVFIKSVYLNNRKINDCFTKIGSNESIFCDLRDILYWPRSNKVTINVIVSSKEYQYSCEFYRKQVGCVEEIGIGKKGLWCSESCSSDYDY
jgi:hypothetical protein